MKMTDFLLWLESQANEIAEMPFSLRLWLCWGSFGGITLLCLLLCVAFPCYRRTSKRPYGWLVLLYTGATFLVYLPQTVLATAMGASVLFGMNGILWYGLLVALGNLPVRTKAVSVHPVLPVVTGDDTVRDVSPALGDVRLSHAISITERLLEKPLGRGDRQEIERIAVNLRVMQSKEGVTTSEGQMLNQNLNSLLKLMAKYDG